MEYNNFIKSESGVRKVQLIERDFIGDIRVHASHSTSVTQPSPLPPGDDNDTTGKVYAQLFIKWRHSRLKFYCDLPLPFNSQRAHNADWVT